MPVSNAMDIAIFYTGSWKVYVDMVRSITLVRQDTFARSRVTSIGLKNRDGVGSFNAIS